MHNIYVYIIIMALVTYAIRMLPLVVFRKPINNKFFKSFLYYVPFVTLSVMTFPSILECTGSPILGSVSFILSILLSYMGVSLPITAFVCCVLVYILQWFV